MNRELFGDDRMARPGTKPRTQGTRQQRAWEAKLTEQIALHTLPEGVTQADVVRFEVVPAFTKPGLKVWLRDGTHWQRIEEGWQRLWGPAGT